MLKRCCLCEQELPLNAFSYSCSAKDNKQTHCKACSNTYAKQDYRNNPKPYRARAKKFRELNPGYNKNYKYKNPERWLLYGAKSRAKRKNIEFNLELEDIIIPERCPILGIKLQCNHNNKPEFNSPSIDRIIPKLGYIPNNIRIISYRANLLKSDGTIEELEAVLKYMISNNEGVSKLIQ